MKKLLTISLLILATLVANAQNREGLNYGLKVGVLFANNKTAEYFNGGANSLLNHILIDYPENYYQISNYFNSDFELMNPNFPAIMKYKPSLQIGATLQYYFNEQFAFVTNLNLAKVRSQGIFQIHLASPPQSPQMNDQSFQEGIITSTENRFNFELGAHYAKPLNNSPINPFVEGGAIVAALAANSNNVEIGDFSYTLYNKSNTIDGETNRNYFGYGAFASVGAKFPMEGKATLMLSFDMRAVNFASLPPNAFTLQNSLTFSVIF